MSVSDPLLKSVKYLVQEFHSVGEVITDQNIYLEKYCTTLEQCFLKGMKKGQWDMTKINDQSGKRKRFWKILGTFETDGPMPYTMTGAMTAALANVRLKSSEGRLRYIIRHCLVHKSLHVLVEFLMTKKTRLKEWYFENQNSGQQAMHAMAEYGGGSAIIIKEELAEQLRSLLLTASTSLTFNLNLSNAYFLDVTWQLPLTATMELVPTQELGIGMIFFNGYTFITRIKRGSVAADAADLAVGDVLVEMNDETLYPATVGGDSDVVRVWRRCRHNGHPCTLTVVKPKSSVTGSIYGPLKATLREFDEWMKRQSDKEMKKNREELEQSCVDSAQILDSEATGGRIVETYSVRYIGEAATGIYGGANQIEGVIRRVLQKRLDKTTFDVTMNLTQIDLETQTSEQSLFKHKYADISCCGRLTSDKLHFCYIAGDTFCTISKQFTGYVYEAQSLLQAKTILASLHEGFQRTTWFM